MYKPRWIQKLWANFFGYFWKPCPLCGEYFGGHEWGRWDHFSVRLNDRGKESGKGTCFYCATEIRDEIQEIIRDLNVGGTIYHVTADYSSVVISGGSDG